MDTHEFLKRLKDALENGLDFVPRQKNLQFLADFGLDVKTLKQTLMDLDINDCKEGPVLDKDRDGELWMFKIKFEDIDNIYIKLKLYKLNGKEFVKCISFHN